MDADRPSTIQVQCSDCWCHFNTPIDDPALPDGPFICPQCLGDDIKPSSFPPVEAKTIELECSVCGAGITDASTDTVTPYICSSCRNPNEDQ